jgi:hypothetical protein
LGRPDFEAYFEVAANTSKVIADIIEKTFDPEMNISLPRRPTPDALFSR